MTIGICIGEIETIEIMCGPESPRVDPSSILLVRLVGSQLGRQGSNLLSGLWRWRGGRGGGGEDE